MAKSWKNFTKKVDEDKSSFSSRSFSEIRSEENRNWRSIPRIQEAI